MLRADDFDHALALANDTDYALTAGLFSRSPSRIADATRAAPGRERVREPGYHRRTRRAPAVRWVPASPASASKAGGPDYLLQFVESRVVTENTIRQGFAPPPAEPVCAISRRFRCSIVASTPG